MASHTSNDAHTLLPVKLSSENEVDGKGGLFHSHISVTDFLLQRDASETFSLRQAHA